MTRLIPLEQAFVAAADPTEATRMAAYVHNQFAFYGVRAPQRRQLYKNLITKDKKNKVLDWDLLDAAWTNPYRELDYFVCDYLRAQANSLTASDLSRLLPFLTTKQWWESIDSLAPTIGIMAGKDPQVEQVVRNWANSDDIWLRRVAIIHQLGRKTHTDTALLEQILLTNLGSQEFFINKAIGWALRDYSKTDAQWVKTFLNTHQEQLAPLSLREASKYLSLKNESGTKRF